MGNHYLQQGNDKMNAKDFAGAVPLFDQAATYDDNTVRVTAYTQAALALVNTQKDSDLPTAQSYTQKALAVNPKDPEANYIAGVVDTFIWTGSHKDTDKAQAINYLTTADSLAKAASNTKLASQVEDFQAAHFPAVGSH
jgi:tetratricopeptide (TPR) repeat protein